VIRRINSRRKLILWQLSVILLGTSWLWAPTLNQQISSRTALISQYEAVSQSYSWLFRLADLITAGLIIWAASLQIKSAKKWAAILVLLIGIGLAMDPLLPTVCRTSVEACQEYFSPQFLAHAIETAVTATAFFALGIYDVWQRRRLLSVSFVFFQLGYGGLFITQLATHARFNTLSQYVYQTVLIAWIVWYCADYLYSHLVAKPSKTATKVTRYIVAVWTFLNGIVAILISLSHIHLLGRIRGLYYAGDTAWLAQHGVIIGVLMLYLSRQLAKGDLRARQILLLITGLETIKYAVIAPQPGLMLLYLLTFAALFVLKESFDRGAIAMTLKVRLKEASYMLGALLVASLVGLLVLYRTRELSDITRQSIDHFFDYTITSTVVSKTHIRSQLLAHTFSAFLLSGLAVIVWILFKPSTKHTKQVQDHIQLTRLLKAYSNSSEDYFKLWPADKQYFWNANYSSFIAYRIVGSVVFALADPIGPDSARTALIETFIDWCRNRRLRVCFLLITEASLVSYKKAGLQSLQIGASALIDIDQFLQETAGDKWWRWQKNRAQKNGYVYYVSQPPHSQAFVNELKEVSDAWLKKEHYQERGFALGYFDGQYINACPIHFLRDTNGHIVAFTNQVPSMKPQTIGTVDLLRYRPTADQPMPYLLFKTMERLQNNFTQFDLGFVPFTTTNERVVSLARILSAGRFSVKGLEQFKNKFKPSWQPNYLAYDGDLGDLTLIAINLEKVMAIED